MKKSLTLLLFLMVSFSFGQTTKCKTEYDDEINKEVYVNLDVYPEVLDDKFTETEFITANFKTPKKDYYDKLRVKFAWIVETNGNCTFAKLITPVGDKEMEAEAKRIVSLLPIYTPGKCGGQSVPSKVDFEFTLGTKK
ncbi:MAG TPA: hypothetical protein VN026_00540 [Bacteroidia bacterium]|jgi:hypothetical protein|nr:hypothetical protein [Bacteroidia bacterium]